MKIIFLDHDGVLCLPEQWGSREKKQQEGNSTKLLSVDVKFDNFDREAIKVLNEIIEETNCEIVVTSDWRYYVTIEEMGVYYEHQGVIKKPIDYTSNNFDPSIRTETYEEDIRDYQIAEYLKSHPEITRWVAIDDMYLKSEHFVHSIFNIGLNNDMKEEILKYLK